MALERSDMTSRRPCWCLIPIPVGIEPFSYVKICLIPINLHRSWPRNVTAAILVSRKNKTAAMFVSQTNPVGVELFFPYT